MRGMWQHLERLGGGVGTRGPGESQLESDRRMARRRISILRGRLKELQKQRDVRRKERKRTETPTVALAGYTNVGKSTLLNALTDADVSVRNRLFETLDPTTRGFEFDGRRYLVTDTVGFVRRLPHQLVEGFAATLEETLVADLVLHVADASASDETLAEQIAAVNGVLAEIGADRLPVELVVNKVDAVDVLRRRRLSNRYPDALLVSAAHRRGPRRAARTGRGPLRGALRARSPAASVRRGREAERAVRARRADRAARGHERGRAARRAAAAPRNPALRALPRRRLVARARDLGRHVIELPVRRLRDDAVLPSQAYPGDAGLDLAACERVELGPGERALVGTGLAVAIPDGYAGFVQPRSGLAARHGITIVNTPGLVDSGYRGELRVVLLNTDARETFVVEPGMRIAQLVVIAVPGRRGGRGRRAARERAGRARVRLLGGLMAPEPRIRVSALLRWEDRILLCRHEKAGRGEYWLLPGGGVNAGESLVDALHRELSEEVGIIDEIPLEGPGGARRLDLAAAHLHREARRAHRLRRRPLRPLARGGDLERRRGARTPALPARRARRDRRAPADPALPPPLAAGRPGGVPRLALGALTATSCRRSSTSRSRATARRES